MSSTAREQSCLSNNQDGSKGDTSSLVLKRGPSCEPGDSRASVQLSAAATRMMTSRKMMVWRVGCRRGGWTMSKKKKHVWVDGREWSRTEMVRAGCADFLSARAP